jgi:sarcosine oxidase
MTVASCDVAVIGLGIAGASAAWQLARRGQRVIALEQFAPGHDRGSSHGESRIIRLAYAEDPSYVPLLRAAYAGWRALEAETGREVMTVTGILEAGRPGAKLIAGSLASAHEHDLPHEVLSPAESGSASRPSACPPTGPRSGSPMAAFLRAEIAVSLLVERARHAGAVIRPGARVDAIEPGPTAVRLRIGDDVVEAGTVIVAAGSWNRELVPVLAPRLALTEQVLAWFAPLQPGLFVPGRFPVFILEGEMNWYGFPDFAGTGLKVAAHRPGRPIPSPAALQREAGRSTKRGSATCLRATCRRARARCCAPGPASTRTRRTSTSSSTTIRRTGGSCSPRPAPAMASSSARPWARSSRTSRHGAKRRTTSACSASRAEGSRGVRRCRRPACSHRARRASGSPS